MEDTVTQSVSPFQAALNEMSRSFSTVQALFADATPEERLNLSEFSDSIRDLNKDEELRRQNKRILDGYAAPRRR